MLVLDGGSVRSSSGANDSQATNEGSQLRHVTGSIRLPRHDYQDQHCWVSSSLRLKCADFQAHRSHAWPGEDGRCITH
jgi:hypothetical protein